MEAQSGARTREPVTRGDVALLVITQVIVSGAAGLFGLYLLAVQSHWPVLGMSALSVSGLITLALALWWRRHVRVLRLFNGVLALAILGVASTGVWIFMPLPILFAGMLVLSCTLWGVYAGGARRPPIPSSA